MYDIFYLGDKDKNWEQIKFLYPKSQIVPKNISFDELKSKSFTSMFWIIRDDLQLKDDFDLNSYRATKWDNMFVHVFKNNNYYDGICLIPKSQEISNKEFEHKFFVNKKCIEIEASRPVPFERFFLKTYDDYLEALSKSSTAMFWAIWDDIDVFNDFNFDYYIPYYDWFHRNITHVFKNGQHYDGICLFSKVNKVSKKEFDYRFFNEKKEMDVVASTPIPYDKFTIDTYDDYVEATEKTSSTLFWAIPKEIQILDSFDFNFYTPERNFNHVFKHQFRNEETYNGLMLLSKNKLLTAKEINFRFLIEKKQHDILASKLKPYDIIFISYNESNAEENFQRLQKKFPRAKRVHGVKGIHNAHKKAADISDTDMFWVVDGDAVIEDNFSFDYEVSRYELDIVHVWKSRNPINNLVYGYGGVKLLPKLATLNMDLNSADMTTSISKRFKPMPDISNSTQFNTDPFSTWKSAFRECVKLSSKTIVGQIDKETEDRLDVWCSLGESADFGTYAIKGAIEGRRYGEENRDNIENLKKINDFDWLRLHFENTYA